MVEKVREGSIRDFYGVPGNLEEELDYLEGVP